MIVLIRFFENAHSICLSLLMCSRTHRLFSDSEKKDPPNFVPLTPTLIESSSTFPIFSRKSSRNFPIYPFIFFHLGFGWSSRRRLVPLSKSAVDVELGVNCVQIDQRCRAGRKTVCSHTTTTPGVARCRSLRHTLDYAHNKIP